MVSASTWIVDNLDMLSQLRHGECEEEDESRMMMMTMMMRMTTTRIVTTMSKVKYTRTW